MEARLLLRREQREEADAGLGLRIEVRPGERQDVGAEGIADEHHGQLAGRVGVGEHRFDVGRDLFGLARLPERLHGAYADHVNVLCRHPFADGLVEILPAAVAGVDDRDGMRRKR